MPQSSAIVNRRLLALAMVPINSRCQAHEMFPEQYASHHLWLHTEPLFIRVTCSYNIEASISRAQILSHIKDGCALAFYSNDGVFHFCFPCTSCARCD
jgi:hypothetical protein